MYAHLIPCFQVINRLVCPGVCWFLSCILWDLPVPGKPRQLYSLPGPFLQIYHLFIIPKRFPRWDFTLGIQLSLEFSSYKTQRSISSSGTVVLKGWFSTSRSSIPCELVRNVNSWAPPQTLCCDKSSRGFWCFLQYENIYSRKPSPEQWPFPRAAPPVPCYTLPWGSLRWVAIICSLIYHPNPTTSSLKAASLLSVASQVISVYVYKSLAVLLTLLLMEQTY